MATKHSRDEDDELMTSSKKMHAETVHLLDDVEAVHGQLESVGVLGEENAVEECLVSDAVGSVKADIHKLESVCGEGTSTFYNDADSCDVSLLDSAVGETAMDSSASRTVHQVAEQMPENGSPSNVTIPSSVEVGSAAAGSPLGYLHGASDDELGLPPPGSMGCESAASLALLEPAVGFLFDDWRFDEEFQAMQSQGHGFYEADDAWGEPDIAVDDGGFCSLFDHSDIADGSSFFLFSGNASS
ncbi:unnamed protein product [Victoria cruziana]